MAAGNFHRSKKQTKQQKKKKKTYWKTQQKSPTQFAHNVFGKDKICL